MLESFHAALPKNESTNLLIVALEKNNCEWMVSGGKQKKRTIGGCEWMGEGDEGVSRDCWEKSELQNSFKTSFTFFKSADFCTPFLCEIKFTRTHT